MSLARALAATALLAACATTTTPPAPPRPADPAVTEPEPHVPAPAARPTPWRIHYADGSANGYDFAQASPGGLVAFQYTPVTPAMSSTGQYSGGDPHRADLSPDDARIDELWRRVEALEADTASHHPSRDKGTGSFAVTTPSGTRQLIIAMGPALEGFHAFVAAFRPQPR